MVNKVDWKMLSAKHGVEDVRDFTDSVTDSIRDQPRPLGPGLVAVRVYSTAAEIA